MAAFTMGSTSFELLCRLRPNHCSPPRAYHSYLSSCRLLNLRNLWASNAPFSQVCYLNRRRGCHLLTQWLTGSPRKGSRHHKYCSVTLFWKKRTRERSFEGFDLPRELDGMRMLRRCLTLTGCRTAMAMLISIVCFCLLRILHG